MLLMQYLQIGAWYQVENGANENFRVDAITGVIHTKRVFDREAMLRLSNQDAFSMVVIATDFGSTPSALSSSAVVEVVVTDVNDNAPKFVRDVYEPSLFENAEVNTQVRPSPFLGNITSFELRMPFPNVGSKNCFLEVCGW